MRTRAALVFVLPILLIGCPVLLDDFSVGGSDGGDDASDGRASDDGANGDGRIGDAHGSDDAGDGGDASAQDAADSTADAMPDSCARVTHSNGLGQTFDDCVPLGTHDMMQAMKACVAFTADAAACRTWNDPNGCLGSYTTSPACAAWEYTGPFAGHVLNAGGCFCPSASTDPAWN